jgi:post-segregation antitoxin (ccd killing protein)
MVMNPQEAQKAIVSAQINASIREELLRRAEEADRSLSAEIRTAIREHLRRDDEEET